MENYTEGFDWESFLMPYEQAVNELTMKFGLLMKQYENKGEHSPVHYVSGRVKSANSIMEKTKKYDISLDEISYKLKDIAGIRLVTQFEEDISVLAKLIDLRSDMRVVMLKDYFTKPKESGYKSVHMIIEYEVNSIDGVQTVLCEIQLRTLAMDFWAIIEHSLNYKYRDEMPADIRERLFRAAEGVMALDSEMGKIRDEITDAQRIFGQKLQVVSRIYEDLEILKSCGFSEAAGQYLNDFEQIRAEDNILQLFLLEKELDREIKENINTEAESK